METQGSAMRARVMAPGRPTEPAEAPADGAGNLRQRVGLGGVSLPVPRPAAVVETKVFQVLLRTRGPLNPGGVDTKHI
jgi:hypothetical protein